MHKVLVRFCASTNDADKKDFRQSRNSIAFVRPTSFALDTGRSPPETLNLTNHASTTSLHDRRKRMRYSVYHGPNGVPRTCRTRCGSHPMAQEDSMSNQRYGNGALVPILLNSQEALASCSNFVPPYIAT